MARSIRRLFFAPPQSERKSTRQTTRPKLESLEDRLVLNGQLYLVTSGADSGPGSLRAAAAAAGDNDSISFSINGPPQVYLNSPITLTQNNLTINNGSVAVTISGQGATRIFEVAGGSPTISGLTFQNGETSLPSGPLQLNCR